MAQLMTKRIPVSEDLWKQLGKLKEAGQTYDDLMRELIQARNRLELAKKMDSAEKGKGKWFSLEEV
ncbi:MAG: hypothetical protein ABIA93_08055 [Candidatus Woesearchaeota archaeon]